MCDDQNSSEMIEELYTDLEPADEYSYVAPEPKSVAEMLQGRKIVSMTINAATNMPSYVIGGIEDLAPDEYGMISVFAPYLLHQTDQGLMMSPLVKFADGWMNQVSRHAIVACGDVKPDHLVLYMDLIANIHASGTESIQETQRSTVH